MNNMSRKVDEMSKKNKILLAGSLVGLALLLAACGGTTASTTAASSNTTRANGGTGANATAPLPLATELLVGTLKLEGTPNAVDAKTAAALIPLWQMMKELAGNSSAAQAEIDSVVADIKSTMSPAQIQAISDMHLTQRDSFSVMQDLGLGTGRTGASGTPSARTNGGGGGGFLPGGDGGGFPGGGGFTGGNTTTTGLSAAQIAATAQASRSQSNAAARIPSALLDAIIQLMQQKSGATPVGTQTPDTSIATTSASTKKNSAPGTTPTAVP
jgi:hypothetical protein